MKRVHKHYAGLVSALDRAVAWAGDPAAFGARAEEVSEWSVGQHLEHLLLGDRRIVDLLAAAAAGEDAASKPGQTGGPSWRGWIVLLTGFIPRGKGKAPDFTIPKQEEREEVEAGFGQVVRNTHRLGECLDAIDRSPACIRHPALGTFTAAQWLRFAGVHHVHHEKIVREILRAAGRPAAG